MALSVPQASNAPRFGDLSGELLVEDLSGEQPSA
jgi:hypothetical protein